MSYYCLVKDFCLLVDICVREYVSQKKEKIFHGAIKLCDLVICFSEDTNEKSLDRNNLMFTEIGILARLIGIRNFGYNDYKPVDEYQ